MNPTALRPASPSATPDANFGLSRRLIATVGSLVTAAAIPMQVMVEPFVYGLIELVPLFIPTALCLLSAVLLHRRHLGGQMLARATWWSNLILGTLISISTSTHDEYSLGLMLALGSGAALLAMGRAGLGHSTFTGRFNPVAFRGSLIVAMVMALADTQSLLMFGSLSIVDFHQSANLLPLICAAVMVVAVIGLYRLAVWGLALNLIANLGIAALGLTGALGLPEPIVGALVTTAVLQLLLPLPLLSAFVRGASEKNRAGRNWWPVLATVVFAMMAVSAYAVLLHPGRLFHF